MPKKTSRFALRRVLGESMYPALEHGQWILVKRCTRYRVGEVVVFRRGQDERIKRVSSVENEFYYVLGDNPNYSKDSRDYGYISQKDVVGKVVVPRRP